MVLKLADLMEVATRWPQHGVDGVPAERVHMFGREAAIVSGGDECTIVLL